MCRNSKCAVALSSLSSRRPIVFALFSSSVDHVESLSMVAGNNVYPPIASAGFVVEQGVEVKMKTNLVETDVRSLLTEALTADVHL
ncbi:hypothetical protein BO99DRAFT_400960 [Aspergillus violaceofuscus CBS 115571]|uniref:Uncharacterized protein n=1 Tax=Aspergillus violaceofuscus (strain CBS 115571) TaxID=1450538 RepID=A0A2V5HJ09_ASPV1|nr:hypothetical protein BO99DRAFT_400960 [Aspergillus violaceofuscus CBS 115571]